MTDTDQPREIQIEDLWSATQRGEVEGATVVIDKGVRIEDYRSSLAKGLASIWGLGHLVGPHLVVDEEFEELSGEELHREVWNRVGSYLWSALPPLEELEKPPRQ